VRRSHGTSKTKWPAQCARAARENLILIGEVMKKLITICAVLVMVSSMASAEVIFDTIPNPDPTAMASWGYQACSISELGDYVRFAGTERGLDVVRAGMVSWAEIDVDYTSSGAAYTDPDPALAMDENGWQQKLTFNIYSVDLSGSVPTTGSLIATKTQTFTMPWAPGDGTHPYSAVTFDFSADEITLPDEVIFGLAFDTRNYGANPTGYIGPYCSLNFGAFDDSPFIGTDVDPTTGFVSSTWDVMAGTGILGQFSQSDGGGDFSAGYRPSVEFSVVPEPATMCLLGLGGLLLRRKRRA